MERAAKHLVPLQVTMEITYRCNLSCQHCYIDVHEDSELSLLQIKSILDQLADAGTLYLMLTGGEILMRKDFFEIGCYAREKKFILILLTNGTLVTPENAAEIKRLEPLNVGITLLGARADTHDNITGKKGSFDSIVESVYLLKSMGVSVSLHTLLMDTNIHEAQSMKNLAKKLKVHLQIGHNIVPTRSGSCKPYEFAVKSDELFQLTDCIHDNNVNHKVVKNEVCKAGRSICSISSAGDVFPCLLMPMNIGSLKQSKFSEIWQNNPSQELKHLRSIIPDDLVDCRECELIRYCHRCMGIAYSETGDVTKAAPSACHNASLKSEFYQRRGEVK
jgi:radical SAM protein with 4Fe4S-binding SPASM domain